MAPIIQLAPPAHLLCARHCAGCCIPGSPEPACSMCSINVTQGKGQSCPIGAPVRAHFSECLWERGHSWLWPGGPRSSFHLLLWKWTLMVVTLTSVKPLTAAGQTSPEEAAAQNWETEHLFLQCLDSMAVCAVLSPSSIFCRGQVRGPLAHVADGTLVTPRGGLLLSHEHQEPHGPSTSTFLSQPLTV